MLKVTQTSCNWALKRKISSAPDNVVLLVEMEAE